MQQGAGPFSKALGAGPQPPRGSTGEGEQPETSDAEADARRVQGQGVRRKEAGGQQRAAGARRRAAESFRARASLSSGVSQVRSCV